MKEDLIEFSADKSLEIIMDDENRGLFHSYLPLHVNKFLSLLCIHGQILKYLKNINIKYTHIYKCIRW